MDDERLGMLGAGQRTSERVGGWDDIIIAIRNTALLCAIAAVGASFAVAVSLVCGPWALVYGVPWAFDRALSTLGRWLWNDPHGVDRGSLLAIAALVAAALLLATDPLLLWWPWRWQAHRDTLWGLLVPQRWPEWIGASVFLRAVALYAAVKAWAQVWYLTQRLRQEVMAPTVSGTAQAQANAHDVEIPGVWNPYRDPNRPRELEPVPVDDMRRVLLRNRGREVVIYGDPPALAVGNGAGDGEALDLDVPASRELVEFPTRLFGRGNQGALNARIFATRVLADETLYSGRAAVKNRLITDWSSRKLMDWMQERGYADPPDAMNRRALTGRGRRLLRAVARGDAEPF